MSEFTKIDNWQYWEERFPADVIAIMKASVSQEETQFVLTLPFIRDGYAVSCNGRLLVAWPTAETGKFAISDRCPAILEVLQPERFGDVTEWRTNEGIVLPEPKTFVCEECNGSGVVECSYDHTHECPECDGSGSYHRFDYVDIGAFKFNSEYLRALGPEWRIGWPVSVVYNTAAFIELPNNGKARLMPVYTGGRP